MHAYTSTATIVTAHSAYCQWKAGFRMAINSIHAFIARRQASCDIIRQTKCYFKLTLTWTHDRPYGMWFACSWFQTYRGHSSRSHLTHKHGIASTYAVVVDSANTWTEHMIFCPCTLNSVHTHTWAGMQTTKCTQTSWQATHAMCGLGRVAKVASYTTICSFARSSCAR